MASVFTHAALPLLAGRAMKLPRRVVIAGVFCACAADLDLATFAFDVRAWDPIGHRGFFHSLLFAALLAGVVNLAFRTKAFGVLFASAASHGLLDTLTWGDVGVALFSPLSTARFLAPLRPIPVCPLGVSEYFSHLGATVVGVELVLIVIPVALVSEIVRRQRAGEPFNSLTRATAVWLPLAAVTWLFGPHVQPRPMRASERTARLAELTPYLGKTLEPERKPWSSSFFPAWLGAEAGRWRDSRLTLIGRTLFGTEPSREGNLSPTEKYDLALGNRDFEATRYTLGKTHNARPRPRFWFGLCNGMAAAAIERPEPKHSVELNGQRFEPVDIKALLGEAYFWEAETEVIGDGCDVVDFDTGRVCSMNPADLLIGTVQKLGREKKSFLIEVHPTRQAQYYAVSSARIELTPPADVEFHYELSSTMLPVESGDLPEGQTVGVHPVSFTWSATLALDDAGTIIGGKWRGDPADGPDNIAFLAGGPLLDGGMLEVHPYLRWDIIDDLATRSAAP